MSEREREKSVPKYSEEIEAYRKEAELKKSLRDRDGIGDSTPTANSSVKSRDDEVKESLRFFERQELRRESMHRRRQELENERLRKERDVILKELRERQAYQHRPLPISKSMNEVSYEEYERARKTYERDQRKEERKRKMRENLADHIVLYSALNFMAMIGWIFILSFTFFQVWEWYKGI